MPDPVYWIACGLAAGWLWIAYRFAPRRAIKSAPMPVPARLAFVGLYIFFLIPPTVQVLMAYAFGTEAIKNVNFLYFVRFMGHMFATAIVVGLIALACKRFGRPLWTIGIHRARIREAVLIGIWSFIAWTPISMATTAIVKSAVPPEQKKQHPIEEVLRGNHPPANKLLAVLLAVVSAPLAEEIAFRGLLQGWLTQFGGFYAWLASSLGFGMLHYSNWPDPIPLVLVGLMLGDAYRRSRSLLAPVLAHALFNGLNVVLALTTKGG